MAVSTEHVGLWLEEMMNRYPALRVFSPEKHFSDPWIGHPALNRAGQHVARIVGSHGFATLRRWQKRLVVDSHNIEAFDRDGILVIKNFLPSGVFSELRHEAKTRVEHFAQVDPVARRSKGFGKRQSFAGGFDRYDGGTLNRFIDLDEHTPCAREFANNARLRSLVELSTGMHHRPERMAIYQTRHGNEDRHPDYQKNLHRDTFHFAVKYWFSIDPVAEEQGPLYYVRGSHRLTRERLQWEHRRALQAVATQAVTQQGGAFRIENHELEAMKLPQETSFPVPENTLVIANVQGFHRRGHAARGSERLSLHASIRPTPFAPVPY